ncbi:MAG: GerMN domain-containing protein [Christensenella sp.]|nr:GerMN domain-containing protein [Christensenella sp.]
MNQKRWKTIICMVLVGLLLSAVFGCAFTDEEKESASPSAVVQVNPLPEAVSKDKSSARLYFGYMDQPLLVGESHIFDVPINENIENSVIRELIKGPSSTRNDIRPVINPNTAIVNIRSEGQFLFVTLSKEFLLPVDGNPVTEEGAATEKTRRMLAVYSIVDTLIEQGTYSRVQILIDDEGSGTGRPLTAEEAGLDGGAVLEPLERNGEIVLDASNTMQQVMTAIENKEWDTLYNFIAYKNLYGQDKPSLEEFKTELNSSKISLADATVLDAVPGNDGTSEIVMVSYVLKLRDDEAKTISNVPIRLVQENSIWKISYTVFKKNFLT